MVNNFIANNEMIYICLQDSHSKRSFSISKSNVRLKHINIYNEEVSSGISQNFFVSLVFEDFLNNSIISGEEKLYSFFEKQKFPRNSEFKDITLDDLVNGKICLSNCLGHQRARDLGIERRAV